MIVLPGLISIALLSSDGVETTRSMLQCLKAGAEKYDTKFGGISVPSDQPFSELISMRKVMDSLLGSPMNRDDSDLVTAATQHTEFVNSLLYPGGQAQDYLPYEQTKEGDKKVDTFGRFANGFDRWDESDPEWQSFRDDLLMQTCSKSFPRYVAQCVKSRKEFYNSLREMQNENLDFLQSKANESLKNPKTSWASLMKGAMQTLKIDRITSQGLRFASAPVFPYVDRALFRSREVRSRSGMVGRMMEIMNESSGKNELFFAPYQRGSRSVILNPFYFVYSNQGPGGATTSSEWNAIFGDLVYADTGEPVPHYE